VERDVSDPIATMSCDDADLLLAGWAVSGLDPAEHRRLRRHLAGCHSCRALGAAYLRAADALPLAVEEVEPPPELRSRLLAAVHAEASGQREPRPDPAPWWRRLWSRVPASRGITAAGALVTAAAVAGTVVAVATRPAPAPPVSVVQSCGLTAQPAACGTLRYDASAHQAVLTVTGLPDVVVGGRPTASYEVWLVRSNRSVVPASFLTLGPDGRTYSAAMSGDLSQFTAVATTREAFGGASSPTGPEVLRLDLVAPS
jgi:anti-sigma-K factor RskA